MPEETLVQIHDDERARVLTLDHPPVNALSRSLLKQLGEALEKTRDDNRIAVVIITGAGQNAFAAGADIRELALIHSKDEAARLAAEGQTLFNKIEHFPKPVIAAINAVCLGGGNELALACHIRIASERARFGQPEVNLGIIPGFGGTQRLARLVGLPRATELVLTGDIIPAKEAERIGLINRSVPDGEELKVAKGIARKIASKGQVAVRKALQALVEGREKWLTDGLALEASLFGDTTSTDDMKEGIQAFLEKRQPQFKDR